MICLWYCGRCSIELKNLDKIKADQTQKEVIQGMATVLSKNILNREGENISVPVIKGFLWRALRNWQKKYGITVEDTETGEGSSPSERINQARQILALFKTEVLSVRGIDTQTVDIGIFETMKFYEKNYARR